MTPTPTWATKRLSAELYTRMHLDHHSSAIRPSEAPNFARREAIASELQRDGRFPVRREPLPVPEVCVADRANFLEVSQGASRPVVFRGFNPDLAEVWDPARLVVRVGDTPVTVMRRDDDSDGCGWDVGIEHLQLPFDEFIRRLPDEPLYLNNSTELFMRHPDLEADLCLDRLQRLTDPRTDWDELLTTNLFIGTHNVRTAIHAAWGGNFFVNLVGRKRWRFIAPEYAPYLNPVPARPFEYAMSSFGGFAHSTDRGEHDAIFYRLPWEEVVLEPGDVLYSAPWWWHEVENLTPITVATAIRHVQPPGTAIPSLTNSPAMALGSRYVRGRSFLYLHFLLHLLGRRIPLRPHTNRWVYERLLRGFETR